MSVLFVGPVLRSGGGFAYAIFDGKVVTLSFGYPHVDQARYARDREAGTRIDTTEAFDRLVAPVH
jgi:hypothetical protein